jgi:hypothetical protein
LKVIGSGCLLQQGSVEANEEIQQLKKQLAELESELVKKNISWRP